MAIHSFPPDDRYHQKLVENLIFEVVPLSTADAAIEALPPAADVSVTCSPVKGIEATMALTDRIRAAGHTATPHLAARMVEGPDHVARIAAWLRSETVGRAFVVGGDAQTAAGPYSDALAFLTDLLKAEPELHTIGVTAYPDSHPLIPTERLRDALLAKQAVLREAGITAYASTQMCFDPDRIASWLEAERAAGLQLPIHLGLPGVVDRAKLMKMGVRLGVGTSLRYLQKNRRALTKLMARGDYDPSVLIDPLAPHLQRLGIEGIHCFTFNQVAATEYWRRTATA